MDDEKDLAGDEAVCDDLRKGCEGGGLICE